MGEPDVKARDLPHLLLFAALAEGAREKLGAPSPPHWVHHLAILRREATPEISRSLLEQAQNNDLGDILAVGLKRMGLVGEIPWAEAHKRQSLARRMVLMDDRRDMARVLQHIPHVFLKGAVADLLWWPDGSRRVTDLDILIKPQDEADATRALGALGFQPEIHHTHPVTNRVSKERLFLHAQRDRHLALDLHVAPLNTPPFSAESSDIISRRQKVETPDGSFWIPSDADAVALAAGNLAGDRFLARQKLALDAFCYVGQRRVDLASAAQLARKFGCAWSLWALLLMLRELMGADIPSQALDELSPPLPLRRWMDAVAGASRAPLPIRRGLRSLMVLEWPLSQRWSWPVEAVARWAALRAADRYWLRRHKKSI